MPLYSYTNDKTGETVEVLQTMTEEHRFFDKKGVEWRREFSIPQASFTTKIDPNSQNAFVSKTANMRGDMGNLWEFSEAQSEARKHERGEGYDPVKAKYLLDERKKRNGKCSAGEMRLRMKESKDKVITI